MSKESKTFVKAFAISFVGTAIVVLGMRYLAGKMK